MPGNCSCLGWAPSAMVCAGSFADLWCLRASDSWRLCDKFGWNCKNDSFSSHGLSSPLFYGGSMDPKKSRELCTSWDPDLELDHYHFYSILLPKEVTRRAQIQKVCKLIYVFIGKLKNHFAKGHGYRERGRIWPIFSNQNTHKDMFRYFQEKGLCYKMHISRYCSIEWDRDTPFFYVLLIGVFFFFCHIYPDLQY